MLVEATITPLTRLPTAHPSPEAAPRLAVVRTPAPATRPSEEPSARFTTTAAPAAPRLAA
jgi:hypothetical protein